jgi:putative membrane protein
LPQLNKKTQTENQDQTSWKETPLLALKGFLMGSADIVPGVSGGTMALIVGIYNRLIHAISSLDLQFIKRFITFRWGKAFANVQWKFLGILLTGIFCAALFFTKIVPLQVYMFTHPELVFGIFFGLIVGSIYILVKAIDDFSWTHGLYILAGIAIGLWVVTRVPAETPESSLFIFFSGSIAICAMVLPGISGSYILLILRKYDFILTQLGKIGTVDTVSALWVLAPFVLGAVVGLMLFTRLLSWLLDHYYGPTLAVLIGFLIGSLYVIWPYQNRSYEQHVRSTEVVEYTNERAQALRSRNTQPIRPEYERLGDVINPDATFDGLKQVEIEEVSQKLVKSDPYVPYFTKDDMNTADFRNGIWGMLIGLVLVLGLDLLRRKDEQAEAV